MTKEDLKALPTALAGATGGVYKYTVRPFAVDHAAHIAWGVTLSIPAMYDAWAVTSGHQTMSNAFHEGMDHPMYRYLCIGALGVLALHLCHGVKASAPPELAPGEL